MYIIVNPDGGIWNWYNSCWQKEEDVGGQMYRDKWKAKKVAEKVSTLQGSLFGGATVMTYPEWEEKYECY